MQSSPASLKKANNAAETNPTVAAAFAMIRASNKNKSEQNVSNFVETDPTVAAIEDSFE